MSAARPLFPRKRTSIRDLAMSIRARTGLMHCSKRMELIRYPIAIRLRRSRREAISMRYVTSASTAHARGPFPKVGEGGQRCRVNGELAAVRNGLDHKDPSVCAAKPAT